MLNKFRQSAKTGTNKFIKAIMVVGTTLFITLNAGANPTSAAVEKEIAEVFKKNPDKEIVVKVEKTQTVEKAAKFDAVQDTIQDPYDQIKGYVDVADTAYFMQLKKHMETKDQNEQIKCKAVVYAILQDTALNQEQRQTLALAYFERLAKMPGSNYRFWTSGNEKYKGDQAYTDRKNRYSGYKSYLDVAALDQKIAELEEKSKQLDKEKEYLERENNLLQNLLNGYNKK